MTDRTINSIFTLVLFGIVMIPLAFAIREHSVPATCTEMDVHLTAYEWYMRTNNLSYNEWVEYVELSFEWESRGCERKAEQGTEESPTTGHNEANSRIGEWTVRPRRWPNRLYAKKGASEERLPDTETSVD